MTKSAAAAPVSLSHAGHGTANSRCALPVRARRMLQSRSVRGSPGRAAGRRPAPAPLAASGASSDTARKRPRPRGHASSAAAELARGGTGCTPDRRRSPAAGPIARHDRSRNPASRSAGAANRMTLMPPPAPPTSASAAAAPRANRLDIERPRSLTRCCNSTRPTPRPRSTLPVLFAHRGRATTLRCERGHFRRTGPRWHPCAGGLETSQAATRWAQISLACYSPDRTSSESGGGSIRSDACRKQAAAPFSSPLACSTRPSQ